MALQANSLVNANCAEFSNADLAAKHKFRIPRRRINHAEDSTQECYW